MIVGGKYELAGVTAEDAEARTFTAREIPNGRSVLVHEILEQPAGSARPPLSDLLERGGPGKGPLIETFTSEGVAYVVTEPQEGFRSLRGLLEKVTDAPLPQPKGLADDRFTRVGAWRVPAGLPTAPARHAEPEQFSVSGIFSDPMTKETPPPATAPSEFTQMFRPAAAEPPAPTVILPEPPPAVATTPAPAQSGEFTRVFEAPPPPPAPAAPTAAPPPGAGGPGEFTQLFQAPVKTPGSVSGPPSPAAPQPGEFTRLFRAPAATPTPPLTQAPAPVHERAGEFTQYFQSPMGSVPFKESEASAQAAPPPAPPPPQAGEYTRLFQTAAPLSTPPPPGSGATHVFVTPSVPSSQPPAQVLEGPSEFTRMIHASPQAPAEVRPSASPQPAAPQAAPAKPALPLGLVVLFASLAVIAIGLVLYFALRH